jgi:hypothetical protein
MTDQNSNSNSCNRPESHLFGSLCAAATAATQYQLEQGCISGDLSGCRAGMQRHHANVGVSKLTSQILGMPDIAELIQNNIIGLNHSNEDSERI